MLVTLGSAAACAAQEQPIARERLRLVTASNPLSGVAVIVDVPDGTVTTLRFPERIPAPHLFRHDHLVLGPMIASHLPRNGRLTGVRAELEMGTVAPDGRHRLERRKNQWFLCRADAPEAAVPLGRGGLPVWSPDGSRLAWSSPGGLVLLRTGADPSTLAGVNGRPLAWSPDHTRLLLREGDRLELFDLVSGRSEPLDLADAEFQGFVSWSADGRHLYLLTGSNGTFRPNHSPEFYPPALPDLPLARITVYDTGSGTIRFLTADPCPAPDGMSELTR